jgi:alkylhydroperoxidase family enzyme
VQFIRTIQPDEATGELKALYERSFATGVPQLPVVAAWSLRPHVLEAWTALLAAIRSHMDERRFALVSTVAASRIKCTVCTLSSGLNSSKFFSAQQVEALACGDEVADLDPVEQAIVAFAERVALEASDIRQDEIESLRSFGLSDEDIFDIVLTVSYRLGWSTANDAIGYEPSRPFLERTTSQFGDEMVQALMVGRQYELPSERPTET